MEFIMKLSNESFGNRVLIPLLALPRIIMTAAVGLNSQNEPDNLATAIMSAR